MRILCIDDDEDTGFLLKTYLANWNLEAVAVSTVTEARRLIAHEHFSLYIIDGGLTGVSGLEFCANIRKLDKTTPIVFFTGHGYAADRVAGLQAGANAYIVKPAINEVIPTIKRLLAEACAATA
jgi:DNA-binding response OmpR family regulator